MQTLVGLTVMLMVPGYVILQGMMLLRYRGMWLLAAASPLLLMAPAVAISLFALSAGSNLWPLLAILAAPLCCLVLLTVGGIRWFRGDGFV